MRFFYLPILIMMHVAICQEDLKSRVEQLENQVRQLTDEVIQLRQALQSQQKFSEKILKEDRRPFLYDDVIASFQKKNVQASSISSFYRQLIHTHIWLGGYVEIKAQQTESLRDPNVIDLSTFAFSFRSSLSEYLSIQGEVGISEEEKIRIHHSYLIISLDPSINLKAGVIRVPFGRYNSAYSPPSQPLGSMPMVDTYIIPTIWSDPGISLFGQYQPGKMWTLSYEISLSNGFGEGGFNAQNGNIDARQRLHIDNNHEPQWTGRIELIPRLGVEALSMYIGFSGVIGRYDKSRKSQFSGYAIDGLLKIGPFSLIGDHDALQFSGEYGHLDIERDAAVLQQYPNLVPGMWGYYFQIHYQFFPESWRDKFFFFGDESNFGLCLRYETIDLNPDEQGVSRLDDRQVYTMGFNFYPISQTVLRLEYSWIREQIEDWAWNNQFLASVATYF